MPSEVLGRSAEAELVGSVLGGTEPAALLLDGEAGIGKTTVLLSAIDRARERGFTVLFARAAVTESALGYAALADLLAGIEPAALDFLPAPQRRALDRILLRAPDDGACTDPRAVAAALLAVITRLSERTPVLVALDDAQWLDTSSVHAIAFAARRLSGPVKVIGTVRTGIGEDQALWLQLSRPEALQRIRLGPLSVGALHAVLSHRLRRSFSRPTMMRIHEVSGGNPFYAIEFARGPADNLKSGALPPTLAELVRQRIDGFAGDVREALLAVSCLGAPTADLVGRALGLDADDVFTRLADAEDRGIIGVDGDRVRFSHPLLAHGVYSTAAPAARREMHCRLATLVEHDELKAKHLALSATHGDADMLRALDVAAATAHRRGAPAAAAEFVELALSLGGDTLQRRIMLGALHFSAGDAERARNVLSAVMASEPPGDVGARVLFLLGLFTLQDGSTRCAADFLRQALETIENDQALRVEILVPLAFAELNLGRVEVAAAWATEAVAAADRLDGSPLRSIALAMKVLVGFLSGHGIDDAAIGRAVELADRELALTSLMNPDVLQAQLLAGSGRLHAAGEQLSDIRREYLDRGQEGRLTFVDFHRGLTAIWQGRFAEAAQIADEATQRAHELDRDVPHAVGLMLRAAVAAYTGKEHHARDDAAAALDLALGCDSALVAVWPRTTLGFLEVSLGNHENAVAALEPLLASVAAAPQATEIYVTPFLPDAVEALIQLGRHRGAEPLIEALESNGRRLDRPWMLACGGRCRALLLAERGDLAGATEAVERALAEHDRLPMPFERARTLLVLGQLQRRQRHRTSALETVQRAAAEFETIGAALWAEQSRRAAGRIDPHAHPDDLLTASEYEIAELVASGMSNREVGAALFVSAKTVEVHLSRIYRKLGIRSRSELGWRIARPQT